LLATTNKGYIGKLKNPDHKFKHSPIYNFLLVFIGLFFAFFITSPDDWHSPLILIFAAMAAALIALFSVKFINK
jgi:hypothetical protein